MELLSSQCCLNTSKKTIAQKNHLCNIDPRAHGTGKLSRITAPSQPWLTKSAEIQQRKKNIEKEVVI